MTFSDIRGNADVCQALCTMVESGKIPHAIMLHEEDGGGAFPIALAFLDRVYDGNPRISKLIHPDLHFVFPTAAGAISLQYVEKFRPLVLENPEFTEAQLNEALGIEGKNSLIAVSEAKHLLDALSLSALEGGYRSVIVYLPEKMNQEAANRLLKMVEEPPEMTLFLLITHAPEKVLQTIASRCQRIRVVPQSTQSAPQLGEAEANLFTDLMNALAARDLLEAIEVGEGIAALGSRENVKAFCKFATGQLRQIFLLQQGMSSLADASEDVQRWAGKCRKSFPRQAMEAFSRALQLVDRNVNAKIIFTELPGSLYTIF